MKMIKQLFFLSIALSMMSCEWFASKDQITQRIVQQDMESIHWNQVDRYPIFEGCDENASKLTQQNCFQEELQLRMVNLFDEIKKDHESDLIALNEIYLIVSAEGKIILKGAQYNDTINHDVFNRMIDYYLMEINPIYPAIKRGIPVKVYYKMSINTAVVH